MTQENLFTLKCERIKLLTAEAFDTARMFNGFRYHTPSMSFLDVKAAAENMRNAANELDALAEKLKPEAELTAAE